ncbi:hypothetical protein [Kamptonema formosum]|uniref:hypothetical protein n=1 Tax=Kamptonema formosum TaxID=331992 RepID=UPI0003729AEC|nr:hypothetical protein [Oscillatoria sp. PCC 10802]
MEIFDARMPGCPDARIGDWGAPARPHAGTPAHGMGNWLECDLKPVQKPGFFNNTFANLPEVPWFRWLLMGDERGMLPLNDAPATAIACSVQ